MRRKRMHLNETRVISGYTRDAKRYVIVYLRAYVDKPKPALIKFANRESTHFIAKRPDFLLSEGSCYSM